MGSSKAKSHILSAQGAVSAEKRFHEIYDTYFDRLYAYVKVICNSNELTEDILADLFKRFWENKTDFEAIEDLEAYLFVCAKNQTYRALVKELRLVNSEFLEIKRESIEYINPEQLLLEKELKTTFDKAVKNLPDKCQLVFRMSREQGLKYKEISVELGVSVETVKTHLSKAQQRLKEEVEMFYQDKHASGYADSRLIGSWLFLVGLFQL